MSQPPISWTASLPAQLLAVLHLLETTDLGGFLVLVLAILAIGNKLSHGFVRVRALSLSLAGLIFVLYMVSHFLQGAIRSDDLAEWTCRGLLSAGLALGLLWILLTPLVVLLDTITTPLRSWALAARRLLGHLWQHKWDARERRRAEQLQSAWLREREQSSRKAEQEAALQVVEQRRRQSARARCEVLFVLHAFELRERFTQEMFDSFVARHLGDDKSPEYVEQRAGELCDILQKHLEKTDARSKKNLAELAQWFLREKGQIDATALSDEDKHLLVAQLEERYVRLQEKYLRSVEP